MSALAPLHEHAFESLYRQHKSQVYSYALARLRNVDDAEDATQTTFLNAFNALERGQSPRLTEPWLIAIARNVCHQRFREAKRRPLMEHLELDRLEVHTDEPRVTAAEISTALVGLPTRQRSALVMRELEGRSHAEICEALGLSDAALQALLVRARRSARELLEGQLTCKEARRAIKRQYGETVSLAERRALMSHLRVCTDCAAVSGHRRPVQKGRIRTLLGLFPFPTSLPSIFGGGGATAGSTTATVGAASKLLLIAVTGTTVVGVTLGIKQVETRAFAKHGPPAPAAHRTQPNHAQPAVSRASMRVPGTFASLRSGFLPAPLKARFVAAPLKARVVHPKPIPAQPIAHVGSAPPSVATPLPVTPGAPATTAEGPSAATDGNPTPSSPGTSSTDSQGASTTTPAGTDAPQAISGAQPGTDISTATTNLSPAATNLSTAATNNLSTAPTNISTAAADPADQTTVNGTPPAPPVDTGTAGGNSGSDSPPGNSQGKGVGSAGTPPGQADKATEPHSPPGRSTTPEPGSAN